MSLRPRAFCAAVALLLAACGPTDDAPPQPESDMQALVDEYATVRLEADLSQLSAEDRQVVRLLLEAMPPMDDVFWQQAYGDRDAALALAGDDPAARRFVEINYGPWDRLRGDRPFLEGVGPKPAGANFYPADMTKEQLEAAVADRPELAGLYTLVRRDTAGALVAVPYHEAYAEQHAATAAKLREAAAIATDQALAHYLSLRADALENDD